MYVYDMGRLFSKGFAYQPDRKKKVLRHFLSDKVNEQY